MFDLDSDQDGLTDIVESGQTDLNGERVSAVEFTDNNQNGWHDPLEGTTPIDTDLDTTPDYLDLDSNDDGITDIAESGIIDTDSNGMIDTFTDADNNGLHDDVEGLDRISKMPMPDTDTVLNPTQAESGSGGGCSIIGSGGAGSDPLLPLAVLAFATALMQRRRCHLQKSREVNHQT